MYILFVCTIYLHTFIQTFVEQQLITSVLITRFLKKETHGLNFSISAIFF